LETDVVGELQRQIRRLEEKAAELKRESQCNDLKLKQLESENAKLHGAIEDSVRVRQEYIDENDQLRTQLNQLQGDAHRTSVSRNYSDYQTSGLFWPR
jgi:hypothetical protein